MHLNLETTRNTVVLQMRRRSLSMLESSLMYELDDLLFFSLFIYISSSGSCPSLTLEMVLFFCQCATADPDGRKRALLIGGGIANFTDVAATFNGIIKALKEKVSSPN